MILKEEEIPKVLNKVKIAFPNFTNWEYNNKIDEYQMYFGFSLWGEYVSNSKHFYVTFNIFDKTWSGTLSIGKPDYYWSSADFGDACLVNTREYKTLEKAISMLKKRIADLFRAFSID